MEEVKKNSSALPTGGNEDIHLSEMEDDGQFGQLGDEDIQDSPSEENPVEHDQQFEGSMNGDQPAVLNMPEESDRSYRDPKNDDLNLFHFSSKEQCEEELVRIEK